MPASVSDLFQQLESERFTGEIEVTSSQGHAMVLMRDGKFIWAHRAIDRAIERFQRISWLTMPSPNLLTDVRTWTQFVNLLLSENTAQYDRVAQLLKIDRVEVFLRIFFWNNIELHPRAAEIGTMEGSLGFYAAREMSSLLAEAKKRITDWPAMKQRMGSSKRIFLSQIDSIALNSPSESPEMAAYSPEEIECLRLCDGRNSVQDIIRILPEGEFLVVKRLLDLWNKGGVRPKDEEESVISIHTRPEDITFRDIFASIWMAVLVSVFFIIMSAVNKRSEPPAQISQQLLQALEVYRKTEGHYPLTLSELPTFLSNAESLKNFDYSLSDPMHYELRLKEKP